jgi:pimeloyl-ACP methyl ester carboxylesterase
VLRISSRAALTLALTLLGCGGVRAGDDPDPTSKKRDTTSHFISAHAHYAIRDGLRIYLWEKHATGLEDSFAVTGKVALLVHGGTWSGVKSAAADIGSAVEYITKLRGVGKVDLLGWSAGTQRAGLYAMQHPERVAKLILYAPHWKGTAQYRSKIRKRIENGGKPLGQYQKNTEAAARSDFVEGELARHPQFEEDVVALYAKEALQTDPQSPNAFVDNANLPILDPIQITMPTMVVFGEYDYAAAEEDLLPFFARLNTRDKQYVLLPHGGHALILEKDHRRFQQIVLSFFDRP